MKQLAKEALDVHDTCNASGVTISFAKATAELHQLTDGRVRESPVWRLWVSKLHDLGRMGLSNRDAFHEAYIACLALAEVDEPITKPCDVGESPFQSEQLCTVEVYSLVTWAWLGMYDSMQDAADATKAAFKYVDARKQFRIKDGDGAIIAYFDVKAGEMYSGTAPLKIRFEA